MSTKVEPTSGVEHAPRTVVTATSSASSIISPKVSMFAKKSGFVIPKNKLSGSLVPVFRGSKKPGVTDAESEENTKQVLRKTKWGPDLTQDASVRKGRALAYQTRVDQITQQLKLGILEAADDQYSLLAQDAGPKSPRHHSIETSELLEIERREAIGEILKLNPSYKAPADYKPLLKETIVPIPIKEYPGHNFIGLIFGPAGDTQKRLEKETGAKIRVYGTKADIKEEREITASDGNEADGGYEELHVLVSADTYEKVDAAVSLIELLFTPVSAKTLAVSTATVAASGDNSNSVGLGQNPPPSYAISPVLGNHGAAQPFTGPGQTPASAHFQPYPNQWLPAGQSSGFITAPFPNSSSPLVGNPIQVSSSPSNSSMMLSLFGPGPVMSGGFGSVPQSPLAPPRPQPTLQRPNMLQAPNLGFSGSPRNPSLPPAQSMPSQPNFSAPPPFTPHPPTPTGPNQNAQPLLLPHSVSSFTFPDRPLTSAGWSQPPAASPGTRGPTHMQQMMQPVIHPQAPIPMASQPIAMSGGHSVPFRPSPSVAPLPSVGHQSGAPNTLLGSSQFPSSVTIPPPPVMPPSITALKPQQPSSNDFTFQPHRAQTPSSQPILRPGSQPGPHPMNHQNPMMQPPLSPSFRPSITNHVAPPVMQGFPRPQNSNQMGQHQGQTTMPPRQPLFPGPGTQSSATHVPQMGPRHFSPAPPASPFAPRPGNFGQVQQNYPGAGFRPQHFMAPPNQQPSGNIPFPSGRPALNTSVPQQVYDPFSPTAVPPKSQIGGNPQNSRKPDSDPEYDDLMASVGVK